MAKKLFEMQLEKTVTVYVVSEELEDAKRIAESEAEWYDADLFITGSEVRPGERIKDDWRDDIPYGHSEDQTVEWWAQLTEDQIAEREAAEKARREFDANPKLFEV
jgi:hypothetical protein